MAGKKQFAPAEVLEETAHFFRRNGYANSSIDDIVRHTGVNRGSLYATFGNKEALFTVALDHYCRAMMSRLSVDHALPPPVAIGKFLGDLIDTIVAWGPGGCLVTNTCAEYLAVPSSAQERVQAGLLEQEDQLVTYFRIAKKRGELPADRTPAELAGVVVAVRQALCLLWKAGASESKLRSIAKVSLDGLDAVKR